MPGRPAPLLRPEVGALPGSGALPGAASLAGLALLVLGGCASTTPARLVLPSGDILKGSATTSFNGQFYVRNERLNCTGIYEGRNVFGVGRRAPVTLHCSNGKTGSSQDAIYQTGRAGLTLSDGSKATLTLGQE